MVTALFRYALFLTLVALMIAGLAPAVSSAQSEEDQPTLVDAMDGTTPGLLADESPDPDQITYRYALGEYVIQALDPAHTGDLFSFVDAGPFADSRIAVDAGVDLGGNSDEFSSYLIVGCRAGDDHGGYAFRVQPGTGNVSLWRLDATGPTELSNSNASDLISSPNELNRIDLRCALDTLTGTLNGEAVVTASDGTYDAGRSYIGAGNFAESPGALFAVFDNLEVTDLGSAAQASTPAADDAGTEEPATEVAQAAGTPEPESTETATVEPEATEAETAQADATEADEATETPLATLDPVALEAAVIEYALATGPVAGPFVEDVTLFQGALPIFPAGVQVTDFHTEVRFVVPVDAPPGSWAIGFCFWVDPQGNCYDVYARIDGATAEWVYARTEASGASEVLDSGPLSGLDLTPGVSNFIGLSVVGNTAVIIVNSPDPAVSFAIEGPATAGDITRWLTFTPSDPADQRSFVVSTDEFSVWDLAGMPEVTATAESAAPEATETPEETATPEATTESGETETPAPAETPAETPGSSTAAAPETTFGITPGEQLASSASGTLTESEVEIDIFAAGVNTADFYTVATFEVPDDSGVPWDFTIGFRDRGGDDQYRLTIDSAGFWNLAFGGQDAVDTGNIDNLLVSLGDENTVELLVEGEVGQLALNGDEIATLDLSGFGGSGDVWIATAATVDTTSVGRETVYRDFLVFALE